MVGVRMDGETMSASTIGSNMRCENYYFLLAVVSHELQERVPHESTNITTMTNDDAINECYILSSSSTVIGASPEGGVDRDMGNF